MGSFLLPPKPGVCQSCAVDHEPAQAHDQQSLYWQYWFRGQHGRWPTWKDAVAHCSPEVRARWEKELRALNAWTGWEGDTPPGPDGLTPEGHNLGKAEAIPIDLTKPGVRGFKPEAIEAASKALAEVGIEEVLKLHSAVDAAQATIKPWKAPKKDGSKKKRKKKGGKK